jgi:hypothetical protein
MSIDSQDQELEIPNINTKSTKVIHKNANTSMDEISKAINEGAQTLMDQSVA